MSTVKLTWSAFLAALALSLPAVESASLINNNNDDNNNNNNHNEIQLQQHKKRNGNCFYVGTWWPLDCQEPEDLEMCESQFEGSMLFDKWWLCLINQNEIDK